MPFGSVTREPPWPYAVQVLANAGLAAAGHFDRGRAEADLGRRDDDAERSGEVLDPDLAERVGVGRPLLVSLVVNLPPKKGGVPLPASEVAGA